MQIQFVEHGKEIIILQQRLLAITHTFYKSLKLIIVFYQQF